MKKLVAISIALLLCVALAGSVLGGDKPVTLEGKIACAKCTLRVEDQKECQNVLVVEKKGKEKLYYLAKNEVNDKFGGVCMATPGARVTGTIEKKDGVRWITATEITPLTDQG
jgi:hypothetical protein